MNNIISRWLARRYLHMSEEDPISKNGSSVAEGINEFAFNLYSEFIIGSESAEANLFFSPFSISCAVALTYEGARGATAEEIRSVLHFTDNDTSRRCGFYEINADIYGQKRSFTLHTANALWGEQGYPFLREYTEMVERIYSAKIKNLDFDDPESASAAINRWVKKQTAGLIQGVLSPHSIGPWTRLLLTNAIYFKGSWDKNFDENETRLDTFTTAFMKTVQVPMMKKTGQESKYNYLETPALQMLEMPYFGKEVSLVIILPRGNNLSAVERSLNPRKMLKLMHSLVIQEVDVYLPKFRLEYGYSLPCTLRRMGINIAFTERADFSGMDGTTNLYFSDIIHKAFVDVNEEGTEAAAVTSSLVPSLADPGRISKSRPVFRADHPFLFLIIHKSTSTILFMGRIVDPSAPDCSRRI